MSDEDLGAAKEKGVSFLVLTKSSFLSKFPLFLFLCFCFSEKEVEEVSVLLARRKTKKEVVSEN